MVINKFKTNYIMPVSNPNASVEPVHSIETTAASNSTTSTPIEERVPDNNRSIQGLSEAENNDANAITVTIADKKAPIIVLFGPPSCGKTMTLIRLTRFLRKQGYRIKPIKTFRPDSDRHHSDMCDKFDEMINNDSASKSTQNISFMLIEVIKNGRRICQILEAPGEHYHDPYQASNDFPAYVNAIINSENRKIWTIFVEPAWKDQKDRDNYVAKIRTLKRSLFPRDKTIFLFNKIDKTQYVINPGQIHITHAIHGIEDEYPEIFELFRNQNPLTRIWQKYLCDFVPFQTGTYSKTQTEEYTYTQSNDIYPQKLWSTICKLI